MLNPEYIVGLVDGEGSFTSYVRNLKDLREVIIPFFIKNKLRFPSKKGFQDLL